MILIIFTDLNSDWLRTDDDHGTKGGIAAPIVSANTQCTEPCQCVSCQPWACHGALQGQRQALQCSYGGGAWAGGCGTAGQVICGVAVLPVRGDFHHRTRQHSATNAHRALPVCEWPALGIPRGTGRSNAVSVVCSSCGESRTGCCGQAGQVVHGGCNFAECAGAARQRTEPCQCVSGQPWAFHGPLQGQTPLIQCAAGVLEAALGAAVGLGR